MARELNPSATVACPEGISTRAFRDPSDTASDGALILYAIANHSSFLFNKAMGASIGLEEPEPENIIRRLSAFSRDIARVIASEYPSLENRLVPAVQYGNESDIYFDDPELLDVLLSERNDPEPVFGFVHQSSDKQPLKPGFAAKMARLLPICRRLGTRNVTVHLPLDRKDTTPALLDELCSRSFLTTLRDARVSIDLENNWHGSWFGFAGHLIDLYTAIDRRLEEMGEADLKPWFGMTFDSGHFFAQYHLASKPLEPDLGRLCTTLASRIRTLHLHCNDGTGDQHRYLETAPAGTGGGSRFAHNQQRLLDTLPLLALLDQGDTEGWDRVIVSEIAVPFTRETYLSHSRLIFGALARCMA